MMPKVSRLIAVSLGAHFLAGAPGLLVVAVAVLLLVAVAVLVLVICAAIWSGDRGRRKAALAVLRVLRKWLSLIAPARLTLTGNIGVHGGALNAPAPADLDGLQFTPGYQLEYRWPAYPQQLRCFLCGEQGRWRGQGRWVKCGHYLGELGVQLQGGGKVAVKSFPDWGRAITHGGHQLLWCSFPVNVT
jgi:hypothetical protein